MSKMKRNLVITAGAIAVASLCLPALAFEKKEHHAAADPAHSAEPAHGDDNAAAGGGHGAGKAEPGGGHGAWSYEGATGPAKWGELKPDYRVCGKGHQQSPIDLSGHVSSLANDLSLHWKPIKFGLVNNGHTIQANAAPGSYIKLKGKRYDLLQFHFHHSSEHTVAGRPYSMEVHFVHKAADGDLAVLGVFMTPGKANDELANFWRKLPRAKNRKAAIRKAIDAAQMLPSNRATYRYAGSLTTPPCSETVNWIVFRDPIQVSGGQIAQFAKLYPANARPVQGLNRRFVLGTF